MTPRIVDDDCDTISVTLDGKLLSSWSYRTETERREKMGKARAFCDGWCVRDNPAGTL